MQVRRYLITGIISGAILAGSSVAHAATERPAFNAEGTTSVDGLYFCNGLVATIVGTPGDDFEGAGGKNIFGTPGPDVIVGLGGHDYINGWEGNDVVCGGPGSDDLYGHAGDDVLLGEQDNDSLEGNSGSDRLFLGGTGDFAPWWEATLRDGNIAAGDYTIWHEGLPGDDLIVGGKGVDGCITSPGEWRGVGMMSGNGGDDVLWGGGGNDCMNSQSGNDRLIGGSGDDVADAGTGTDTCEAEIASSCSPSKAGKPL